MPPRGVSRYSMIFEVSGRLGRGIWADAEGAASANPQAAKSVQAMVRARNIGFPEPWVESDGLRVERRRRAFVCDSPVQATGGRDGLQETPEPVRAGSDRSARRRRAC